MRRIISKVVQKLFGRRRKAAPPEPTKPSGPTPPVVVKREAHTISRSRIDEDALKVLNRLARHNHTAYLVGGGVRDLLLDRAVKDYDISTSAHPHEIKDLFRNCRLIGRRFRLAHLLFRGGKVIEVSTFRKQTGFSDDVDLLIKSDNTFGTPAEDAQRRDFTVNGLFYNIADFTVIDYVGGLEDLKRKLVRTIGDPNIRLREDPIRSLRAVRIAARLGFAIEAGTREAMTAHRDEIWKSAAPRIVDEFVRMLNQGAAAASFPLLEELGMLEGLLPGFARACAAPGVRVRVQRNLEALDAHQKPQGGLPAGLALAVLYHALFADAAAANPDSDRTRLAAELLDADLAKLKFPRAQLEKAVLLLAGQQRILQPQRRRGRGGSLASRPWFAEALTLLEITGAHIPEGRAALKRLRAQVQQEHDDATAPRTSEGSGSSAGEGAEPALPADDGDTGTGAGAEAVTGRGTTGRRRRRSRRGPGRSRGGQTRPPKTETAAGGEDQAETAVKDTAREHRPPPARRTQPNEEIPIDPDAAFGDRDTDLEPPGSVSTEERTD